MRSDNSVNSYAVYDCVTVIVGQPHEAQMCNKSENLQQAVKQITILHYIQLTIFFQENPGMPAPET